LKAVGQIAAFAIRCSNPFASLILGFLEKATQTYVAG
jgi:hypothetical protein